MPADARARRRRRWGRARAPRSRRPTGIESPLSQTTSGAAPAGAAERDGARAAISITSGWMPVTICRTPTAPGRRASAAPGQPAGTDRPPRAMPQRRRGTRSRRGSTPRSSRVDVSTLEHPEQERPRRRPSTSGSHVTPALPGSGSVGHGGHRTMRPVGHRCAPRTSSSSRSAYDSPAAANIRGTCECSVIPGTVLTSLSTGPVARSGRSRPARRRRSRARRTSRRAASSSALASTSSSGGRDPEVRVPAVLRVVVEERRRRRSPAPAARAAEPSARREDRDVDLAADDDVLDQRAAVERAARRRAPAASCVGVGHQRDAEARAGGDRLDHDRAGPGLRASAVAGGARGARGRSRCRPPRRPAWSPTCPSRGRPRRRRTRRTAGRRARTAPRACRPRRADRARPGRRRRSRAAPGRRRPGPIGRPPRSRHVPSRPMVSGTTSYAAGSRPAATRRRRGEGDVVLAVLRRHRSPRPGSSSHAPQAGDRTGRRGDP